MTTEDELAKLEADSLAPGSRVWVTHYFGHFGSSYPERAAFHEALRAGGFGTPGKFAEIGADEVVEGDGLWCHWAFTVLPADPSALVDAERRVMEIADAHNVAYDGWRIERNPLTGQIYPVD